MIKKIWENRDWVIVKSYIEYLESYILMSQYYILLESKLYNKSLNQYFFFFFFFFIYTCVFLLWNLCMVTRLYNNNNNIDIH